MKRLIDILISSVLLILFSPFFGLLAALIRFRMGSPVFFRQVRPGFHGKPFVLLKFRTMTEDRDPCGALIPDLERMTRLGGWIRRTSLDELPQLWNVLRGDMSLVGPRPLLMEYLPRYTPEQARRHEVKPGITGWAQVHGRNSVSWERKFDLDAWYVAHHCFWLDCKILGLTLIKVIRHDGINASDQTTMSEFLGTRENPDEP